MAGSLVIRTGLTIVGSLPSGSGDPQLTVDAASKQVGSIPSVDPSVYLSTTLANGQILIGNASNLAVAVTPTGAFSITNAGIVTLNTGVVFNSNVAALAGIDYSKLNLAGGIINNDINTSAAITRTKIANGTAYRVLVNNAAGVFTDNAAITGSRALISDANGLPTHSTVTAATLAFLDATSSVQTQINTKLTFTASPVNGDTIYYNGGTWNRLAIGSAGQVLLVSAGLPAWGAPTANGVPVGGTAGQYLNKIDATNYNTQWSTLILSAITDITASAAQVNVLATGFYDATSSVQSQLTLKLDKTLPLNSMFVGNASNVAVPLATGANGYLLTSVAGVPTWVAPGSGGTVTSVAASGGTTGLSFTGTPITVSGTLVLTGTLIAVNGGTGQSSYTIGDILYASSTTALSKLAAGTATYVLTSNGPGAAPSWQVASGGSGFWSLASGGTLTGNNSIDGAFSLGFGITTPLTTVTSRQTTYFRIENTTVGGTNTILNLRSQSGSYFSFWDYSPTSVYTGNGPSFQFGGTNVLSLIDPVGGTITRTGTSLGFENTTYSIGFGQWIFGSGGLTAINPNGVGSDGYIVQITSGAKNSGAGSNNAKALYINPTLNYNVAGTHIFTGIDYNPTLTSTTGLATHYAALFRVGSVGIGTATPTARLHLPAGTATASTAPLKLTTGTALGTPEDGAIEYHTSHLYFTIGSTRFQLDQQTSTPAWLLASGGALTADNTISGGFNVNFNTVKSLNIVQSILSSAWVPASKISFGAHTGQNSGASSEYPDLVIGGLTSDASTAVSTRTATWASGTIALQRSVYIRGTVLTGTSATATFTNAYTVYIDSPTQGANASLTNAWALGVAGKTLIDVGTGTTGALNLSINNSAAAVWMRFMTGSNSSEYGRFELSGNGVSYIGGQFKFNFSGVNTNFTQSNNPTSWDPAVTIQAGTHTAITLGTEKPMFTMNTFTQQWATGALSIQRNFWIKSPTYAFVGASVLTDAYNLYVDSPVAGSFATITNNYALGVNGKMKFVVSPTNDNAQTNLLSVDATTGEVKYRTVASLPGGGSGGVTQSTVTTSSTLTTAASTIYTVFVDATAGNIVITLPAGSATTTHIIKRIDSTANTVTFTGATIDGVNPYLGTTGLLPLNGFMLSYNGTNFYAN